MTDKEIMQALRCSATREEREKCEMCRKSKNGCLECINSYVYEAADLVERLTDENAALREKVPTPRDVIILDEDGREYIDYICPKCKETITQARKDIKTMILATRKYHEECGQPLKWPKPGEKYGSKYRGMPLPGAPEEGDKHETTD